MTSGGNRSWKDVAYSSRRDLFGYPEKEDNETIAEAFRKTAAGSRWIWPRTEANADAQFKGGRGLLPFLCIAKTSGRIHSHKNFPQVQG